MSIGVLNQVYDEMRRLSIAGSTLAGGDFRLKKLIPPLEQAGAKVPVLGRVAEAVQKLVDSPPQKSAEALLELSTLTTAILYTQGETGAEGELEPIETSSVARGLSTGGSARLLKPLLEALTTTGSGRLEIIRDAHARGAFDDLRLVEPALKALDDSYAETADFVADKVLPRYGKAIYGELKAGYDPTGKGGHVRRLRLMHRLDPEATRPLVEEALDRGSKEMKLEALVCMGHSRENLPHLLEQARAKAKEVRAAALRALAKFGDEEVVETLVQALSGGDLELAAGPASANPSPKLLAFVLETCDRQLNDLPATKDKAKLKKELPRFYSLLSCLQGRSDKKTVDFLLRAFDRRDEIAKLKADNLSGEDVNRKIAALVAQSGAKPAMKKLVDSHDSLPPGSFEWAFVAAARTRKPEEVYDLFSPYLLAKADGQKRKRTPAADRRETVRSMLNTLAPQRDLEDEDEDFGQIDLFDIHHAHAGFAAGRLRGVKLDSRWLDAAVAAEDLELVEALARPKHKGAMEFLSRTADTLLKKKDTDYHLVGVLQAMVAMEHPQATDYVLEILKKVAGSRQQYYYGYWLGQLIPRLPRTAAPRLEELLPNLSDKAVDELMPYIDELKNKQDKK